MYNYLYPSAEYEEVQPSRFYFECKKLSINGELLISSKACSNRSSTIVAHWPNVIGIDPQGEAPLRAGIIQYFFVTNYNSNPKRQM